MPVLGIDYDKCSGCGICLISCPIQGKFFKKDEEQDKIIFEDPENHCFRCGQCVAQCPEDAIVHIKMGEAFTFKNIENLEEHTSYEQIYNFLAANRSVRHYKKDKVPTEILQKVFTAMECAPTGGNFRSEKFSIISDPDKIKELSDAVEVEMIKLFGDQLDATKAKYHSVVYYDAPHIIFVTSPYDNILANYNMGNIVTYGRLAAQALGLGTCWNGMTQLAIQSNPKIKKIANIKGRIVGAFTIGYPKAKFYRVAPRRMKEVEGLHDVID